LPGAVRDVTTCDHHWYAVGAGLGAWTSDDGRHWTTIPVRSTSPYGRIAVLYSVACRGDRLVAVGAASGGVHGNPRTATWRGDATGLDEVAAPFERFGGPNAVSVDRVVAGPAGFLIVGARLNGGAVWYSADGGDFTLVENDPALSGGSVADAVAVPGGWLLVGSTGIAERDPAAWLSPDGAHWQRETVPANAGDAALDRSIAWRGGILAVGVRGGHFAAWHRDGGTWRAGGTFGTLGGTAVPAVTGLVATPDAVYAAVCDGRGYRLWRTAEGDAWSEVKLPAAAERGLLVAAAEDRLMITEDSGSQGYEKSP
jgi:hypothetical protein